MTSGESLLRELSALGVMLQIDDRGRLSFDAPEGVMTDAMVARVRAYGDALRAILRRSEVVGPEPMPRGVNCPWCRGRRLIDDPEGMRCWDCRRLAWVRIVGAIVRADQPKTDLDKCAGMRADRLG
jgi:hypothetical protein